MFNKDELNYLLIAVNEAPVVDTQSAKNKAFMMSKIAELLEMPDPMPGEIKPAEEPEEEPAEKKAPAKKK